MTTPLFAASREPSEDDGVPVPVQYDLRLLEAFVALAHDLHFGHAAKRLGLAQPALSQQIRRLESQIGQRLFTRDSRRVELTPAGAAFRRHARRSLTLAVEAGDAAVHAGRNPWEHLTLSASSDAVPYVHELLHDFALEHPRTRLDLVLQSHAGTVEAMARHASDAAVVWSDDRPPEHEEHSAALLAAPGGGLVMHEEHPLAASPQVTRDDLGGERLSIFAREQCPGMYDRLVEHLGGGDHFARIDQVSPVRPGLFKDVMDGLEPTAVTASPAWRGELEGVPGLVFRPLSPPLELSVWLIWNGLATPPTHALADFAARSSDEPALAAAQT